MDIAAILAQLATGGGGASDEYNAGLSGITKAESQQYSVFLGTQSSGSGRAVRGRIVDSSEQSGARIESADKAAAMWYEWDDRKQKKWLEDLKKRGILDEDASYDDARDAWFGAVDEASKYYTLSNGSRRVTPWQILDKWSVLVDKNGNGVPDSQEPRTSTQTSKSLDISDPDTARALTNDVLSKALGRAATSKELRAYASALNAYESSNPSVSTTTTTTTPDGNSTSNTETSGGASAAGRAQVLQDKAMDDPEYGAFQVAAPLMDAFFGAIQSPVG